MESSPLLPPVRPFAARERSGSSSSKGSDGSSSAASLIPLGLKDAVKVARNHIVVNSFTYVIPGTYYNTGAPVGFNGFATAFTFGPCAQQNFLYSLSQWTFISRDDKRKDLHRSWLSSCCQYFQRFSYACEKPLPLLAFKPITLCFIVSLRYIGTSVKCRTSGFAAGSMYPNEPRRNERAAGTIRQ